MTIINLFGANNPAGAAFLELARKKTIKTWGRRAVPAQTDNHIYCNLSELPPVNLRPIKGVLVSFAPIWLLAPFLKEIATSQPEILQDLMGIIACSSSSFVTKRFAFSQHDRNLVFRLTEAHNSLAQTCGALKIPLQVLAPTLVYGAIGNFQDKNISKIIRIMRCTPAVVLPTYSGMRQPIHASQLAAVAMYQSDKMFSKQWTSTELLVLSLGGDDVFSYEDMLVKIKENLASNDPARRCKIIRVPDRLFYFCASPLLVLDPKLFESVIRVSSNLSGFTRVCDIIREEPQGFPILPLPAVS
ncbi:MAG: hypothetical protein ACK6BM_00895 [Cyanobacteriota bacterium]|jgi:hypothetical protein